MTKKSPSVFCDSRANGSEKKELASCPDPAPDLAADGRWLLTRRVAQSEAFHRAPRLRAFLLFVVEYTLRNRAPELNEYEIGTRVFDRPVDFDPADDSLVRSSARALRSKLQEYFAGEGKHEPVLIEVPKGSYVPKFVERPAAIPELPDPGGLPRFARSPWIVYGLTAVCILLFAACVLLWKRPQTHALPAGGRPVPGNLVFAVFDQPGNELSLVYSDSILTIVNSIRPSLLSLDDYLHYKEQDALPVSATADNTGSIAARRLVTSFRDTAFGQRLTEMAVRERRIVRPRHSRLMQARDFRAGDFILLGSPWSNPWVTLLEAHLTFRFGADPATGRYGIRNVEPRPGESAFYASDGQRSYALVAFLPSLSGMGRVLLLAGQHAASSEGAEDAALSPDLLNRVRAILGGRSFREISGLELLLEVNSVDGAARGTKIVAWRVR